MRSIFLRIFCMAELLQVMGEYPLDLVEFTVEKWYDEGRKQRGIGYGKYI